MKKGMVILLWTLFILAANIFGYWLVLQYDAAWEGRAKAAGYYDSLPDNLKNPRDLNGAAK